MGAIKNIVISLLVSLAVLVAVSYYMRQNSAFRPETAVSAPPTVRYEYGIAVDSFRVVEGRIKAGQNLGCILKEYGVCAKFTDKLVKINVDGFTAKSIRAGNSYKLFTTPDSAATPVYFVYKHSPIGYYVFNLRDSLYAYSFQKEVVVVQKISEASIASSLWETMSAQGMNPVLALDLSDIFAWTVDFFGIFKGDCFRVLYDELYVDSASVGIGTIYAAWFVHRGERFCAFRYKQDSTYYYWDEKGNSLRKSFLKAPLRFSHISSRYTGSRLHPILKIYRPHTGVDYAAPAGTPVVSVGDGVVVDKGYGTAAGNYITIRHNSVYTSGYNHFSRFGAGMAKGVRVKQGQIIGYVGATGYATGPHLDFRFWMNGSPVDPLKVKSPPVEPVRSECMAGFIACRDSLAVMLDSTLVFN